MADNNLILDIDTRAYREDAHAPVRGGGTRIVYSVPTAFGLVPVIWISHNRTLDANNQPAYDCLLLISKDPPQAVPATIPVEALQSGNIPTIAVEW